MDSSPFIDSRDKRRRDRSHELRVKCFGLESMSLVLSTFKKKTLKSWELPIHLSPKHIRIYLCIWGIEAPGGYPKLEESITFPVAFSSNEWQKSHVKLSKSCSLTVDWPRSPHHPYLLLASALLLFPFAKLSSKASFWL